jgi:hypothetical protein
MRVPLVLLLSWVTGSMIDGVVLPSHKSAASEMNSGPPKYLAQGELPANFNHDATTFPLLGAHRSVKCSLCHLGGQYKNAPRECENCHNDQIAYGKPNTHILTTQSCNTCHTVSAWSPASFTHNPPEVMGRCSTCHNGQKATGKPSDHVTTTSQCDTCHKTAGWIPATFVHDASTVGQCSTCHNGQKATGKPSDHITTTSQCDTCHKTAGWIPATFVHDASTVGQCSTCHNGQTATGKPSDHITTTSQCDTCHKTTGWIPATFVHDASTAGQCSTCHNGQTATGNPADHTGVTLQCDTCHVTTGWYPATYSSHDNPKLIGSHAPLDCKVCHPQNFSTPFYRDGTQYGYCANCHTRDYKPNDNHRSLVLDAMCANCHRHADYSQF